MDPPMPAPIPQSQVPIVKELCEKLGFESLSDRQPLLDSTHQWRRMYLCKDGTFGKDLIQWKSLDTQRKLRKMAEEYVECSGNGPRFWPLKERPTERSRTRDVLEYPEDSLSISTLILQIFWRQNTHETRNAKNPARHHSHSDKNASSQDGGSIVFTAPLSSNSSSWKASHANLPRQERISYSPTSSSGVPYSASRTVSRLASPLHQPNNDGRVPLRRYDEIMANTAGSESATGEKNRVDESNDRSSDIYEFTSDDDEDLIIRNQSKKPQFPIARMVPDTSARDPNFAFDEQPSTKPSRLKKPLKSTNTPRKRRCIGSRVGSEEGDDDYPPEKKRKRTTSQISSTSTHKSGSRKAQEEGESRPRADESPSPLEKTPSRKNDETRKKRSPFNSANLLERFIEAQQPYCSPSIPGSTQDSLASASQSQNTVDVMQQYPAMGERMHSFPAESQIARMSRNMASAEKISPIVPGALPSPTYSSHPTDLDDYELQRTPFQSLNDKPFQVGDRTAAMSSRATTAQPAELSKENNMSSSNENPAQEKPPFRLHNMIEHTRSNSERISPHLPSSCGPTMNPAQNTSTPMADADESSNEHPPSKHESAPAAISQRGLIQADPKTQPSHEARTPAAPSEQPTNGPAPAQLPAPSHPLQPTIVTPTVTATAAPKPSLHIRYTIIKSRFPKFSRQIWTTGGLSGRTMDTLCDEIATLIGRPVLHRISFKLNTSEGDLGYIIERGQPSSSFSSSPPGEFEEMRNEFTEEIRRDWKGRGTTRFEITLEPDPVMKVEDVKMEMDGGVKEEEEIFLNI